MFGLFWYNLADLAKVPQFTGGNNVGQIVAFSLEFFDRKIVNRPCLRARNPMKFC